MSAAGMAPPKPADKQGVKDGKRAANLTANTPDPNPNLAKDLPEHCSGPKGKEVAKAADVEGTEQQLPKAEVRQTRSRSETRGRRLLTCKICRFTCQNSQEFTQHQNSEHAEDSEESSQHAPTRTRYSSRLVNRAASLPAEGEARNAPRTPTPAKKAETSPVQAAEKADGPARRPNNREGLKIRLTLTNPATNPPAVSKTDEDTAVDAAQSVPSEVTPTLEERPAEPQSEEREDPKASEDPERPSGWESPALAQADSMISTGGPGLPPSDLNVSGASEDDDLSEEGGRLLIDDSAGGSGAVPTRCGNIQNRTYMCDDCDFTTTSAQQSLSHQKAAHGYDFTIYSCNLCDYATKYKQKLPRHYKLHFSGTDLEGQIPESMLSMPEDSPTSSHAPTSPSGLALTPATATAAAATTTTPTTPLGVKRSAAEAGLSGTPATPSVLPAEVIVEDGEDEEGEEDELMESDTPTPTTSPPHGDAEEEEEEGGQVVAVVPAKKKRKDVSPEKYFEVAEEVATTKYGCAKCGNVYKWKKSLNKHWKEKHGDDPGDNQYTPPGLHILLQQQNHVQTEHRRCCHKTLLERITVKPGESSGASPHPASQGFLNGHYNGQADDVDGEEPLSYVPAGIPVGPFVLGTSSQPVFPPTSRGGQRQSLINSLNAPIPSSSSSSAGVLDLTCASSLDETDSAEDASKPLDFSVHKGPQASKTPPSPSSRLNPSTPAGPAASKSQGETTEEEDKEVKDLNELEASSRDDPSQILTCPHCGQVLKTQTAYGNHMSMHMPTSNKRVTKCGVCKTHFPQMERLNNHFESNHLDYITTHKEAIQKIPHGLQQTYHLLKMPLQSISKLSSQESEDPLKCNMCDFTAKWPAELQKHAVSHSDERPFVCMVCGSTYKWKWDLVKHFEKAHSTLPNPYKRREAGAACPTSGGADLSGGMGGSGNPDYEMEEGELSLGKEKEQAGNASADASASFLFEQASGQEEFSVENILRTSQQAGLMLSRQPNFLDSPENTLTSSSASPQLTNPAERLTGFDLASLQKETASTGDLAAVHSDLSEDGMAARAGKAGPSRTIRSRPKETDMAYGAMGARPKNGSKMRNAYKGYKTVEGSESSDLKYQCVLCEYKARWPSEIMQHMKNHSSEKPFGCPNCSYRSKWKWDVVKHLKRCGSGGTIKDVIDYTQKNTMREAPPNVMVTPEGVVQSQQAASPSPGTSGGEEAVPVMTSMGSESQTSLLQTPFLAAIAPTSSAASTPNLAAYTTQALVNLIYQQTKAGTNAAAAAAAGSSAQGSGEASLPAQPEGQGSQQPVVYNSISNQGQHHCLHCSFSANSLAELRRHQVLHSEEKPYTCDECSYSTKWKCDMKKHKEKYKHFGPIRCLRPNAEGKGEKPESKKCPQCPFEAHSSEQLQNHVKSDHPVREKSPPGQGRLWCRPCSFYTNDLVEFVNHRRLHPQKDLEDSGQSPSSNGAQESDARIKHPRKAVKKYSCSKCDFVCLKKADLLEHMRVAHDVHHCPFCTQRCNSKHSFLDHIVIHPEFQAKEWEVYFMENSENEEDVNNNTDNPPAANAGKKPKVAVVDTGSSANTIDLTAPATTVPALPLAQPANALPVTSLPCEWCDARFVNIVRLYNHVTNVHPKQKREQEISEGLTPSLPQTLGIAALGAQVQGKTLFSKGDTKTAQAYGAGKRSPSPAQTNGRPSGLMSGLTASGAISLLQAPTVVAQLNQTLGNMAAPQPPAETATGMDILNLSTKHVFQCTTCSFKTSHLGEYQNHIMSHASPQGLGQFRALPPAATAPRAEEMRCWFCPEVFKSFREMVQHMQPAHPAELQTRQGLFEEFTKNLAKDVIAKSQSARRHAATEKPATVTSALSSVRDALAASGGRLPKFLRAKKLLSYHGIPLVPLKLTGREELWYKCYKCNLMDRSPTNIHEHTKKAHVSLAGKYECGHCEFSANEVQTVLQHHATSHKDLQPDVVALQHEEIGSFTVPEKSAGFDPSATSPRPGTGTSGSRSKSSTPVVQTPVIKNEPEPLSPPQDASTPLSSPTDCQPLDLSKVVASPRPGKAQQSKERTTLLEVASALEEEGNRREGTPGQQKKPRATKRKADGGETPEMTTVEAASSVNNMSGVETADAGEEDQQAKFKCKHCPCRFKTHYMLRNHCVFHGLKSRYQCDYCTFSHSALSEVTEHRTCHSHQSDYNHNYVPIVNQSAAASPAPPAAELLRCPDCPYKTTPQFRDALAIHVSMHGQRSQYICDFCDWSTDRLVVLLQHRNIHSNEQDFDAAPEDHVFANPEYAKVASGEFESRLLDSASADGQAQSARSEGQSPPCKMSFTKKSYRCRQCPYVTCNSAAYEFHMSQHGGPGCYACEQCSYHTQSWSRLCQHRRLHTEQQQEVARSGGPGDPAGSGSTAEEEAAGTSQADQAPEDPSDSARGQTLGDGANTAAGEDDDSVEMAEVPDREEDGGGSRSNPAPAEVAAARPDSAGQEESSDGDLQCERCPFRTPSRLHLSQHLKHHAGTGPVLCPCCDYTCPSQETLLGHVQLHFPGLPMDRATLQRALDTRSKDAAKAGGKAEPRTAPREPGQPSTASATSEEAAEPAAETGGPGDQDGGVGDRSEGGRRSGQQAPATTPTTTTTTRVYACRYCDREFEDKEVMLQHEQQHKS